MQRWDWRASVYDGFRKLPLFKTLVSREMANAAELLSDITLRQEALLDVGTGTGQALSLFPPDARVAAADRSLAMLRKARRSHAGRAFCLADGTALPFKSGTFFLVTAMGLFEYQRDALQLLRELRRVTMSGGFVLLTYSPLNLLNFFRIIWGLPIYLVTERKFEELMHRAGLICHSQKSSLIQKQVLLTRTEWRG